MQFHLLEGPQARMIDPQGIPFPDEGVLALYAIEDDGTVVGRTTLMEWGHLEGTWTADSKRGSTLAFRLVKKMEEIVASMGREYLCAFVWDKQPEIAEYMQRIGYEKQELTVWAKKLDAVNKEAA